MNEIKNLIEEIGEWVTEKEDALKIVIILMDKFEITPQDFVNEFKKTKKGGIGA
jgi:hypothetical protein